jgi:hypothetical protein
MYSKILLILVVGKSVFSAIPIITALAPALACGMLVE